jgi:hypothetical protein
VNTDPTTPPPDGTQVTSDRTQVARIALTCVAIGMFLYGAWLGVIPLLQGILLPRLRVLGWWITVVFALLMISVAVGACVAGYRSGAFSSLDRTSMLQLAPNLLVLVGLLVALWALLSKGTRLAVEKRTLEFAPEAFGDPKP